MSVSFVVFSVHMSVGLVLCDVACVCALVQRLVVRNTVSSMQVQCHNWQCSGKNECGWASVKIHVCCEGEV